MSWTLPRAVHFVLEQLLLTFTSVVIQRAGGIHGTRVAVVDVRNRTSADDPERIFAPAVRGFVFDLSDGGKSVASSDWATAVARKCVHVLRLATGVVPRAKMSRFWMIRVHIHDRVISYGQVLPVVLADARALTRQHRVLVLKEHRLELLAEILGVVSPQGQLNLRAGIIAEFDRSLRFLAASSKH